MVVSLKNPISPNALVLDLQGGPSNAQFDSFQKLIRELFEKVKDLAAENQSQQRALNGASSERVSLFFTYWSSFFSFF